MIALYIVGSLVVLAVAVYLLEPFLYAFLFSKLIELFVRNPPFLEVEKVFPKALPLSPPHNCAPAPRTPELLRPLPLISTAMFSIIDGGKHIPPHVGFFKSVLRYHLALVVPQDAPVYIIVGGQEYHWREGQDVLFDDTYLHEGWNKSSQRRGGLCCG